jgi:uncharacterized protein YdeI (YjbR/CyaY-like superfamily)
MNIEVDDYFGRIKMWHTELQQLRNIILDCNLTEEYKWRAPCYTLKGKNILMLGGFKGFCIIAFFKGALLSDANNILVKQGENVQESRVIKFTNVQDIIQLAPVIKAYIHEAITIEQQGLKLIVAEKEIIYPVEFITILNKNKALKKAFEALTPGRKRAYNLFFTGAKQSSTRITRIEKYIPQILSGKGIMDCTCGMSKKMPYCDGSHKFFDLKK